MHKDWLNQFLAGCVEGFDDAAADQRRAQFRSANPDLADKEFIRRYLDHRLRERGVVYGTPLASEQIIIEHTQKGYHQRRAVFMALQQVQIELALEIGCVLAHCTEGSVRVLEMLVCCALFCRENKLAGKLHDLLSSVGPADDLPKAAVKLGRKLAKLLPERAYLAGNPLLGLPMHNSFNYGDAKTFCRLAVVYFEQGRPEPAAIQKVWDYHEKERMLLLQALVGLTLADRPIGVGSRKVMIDQIKSTDLPRAARRELLAMLKQPVNTLAVAAVVSDDRTRDFILEQVLLGAMLDGHFSENEANYIEDLAGWLGISAVELSEIEDRVVDFYEEHQAYLDLFTVGTAVRFYRQRMLGRLQAGIFENMGLIVDEIKAKGNLGELLVKASGDEKLSREEWRQIRRQMVDIVRSIPSLAIFSIPGGAVLLPLIFRVLPDGLKPRTFADRDKKKRAQGKKTTADGPEDPLAS